MFTLNILKKNKFVLICFGLLIGVIIGFFISARLNVENHLESAQLETKSPAATIDTGSFESAISNVATMVGSAVVSISTETVEKPQQYSRRYSSPFGQGVPEDEFFRKFFGDFFGQMPEREFRSMGLGSGVIIDSSGYILTNEHVVRDADKLTVKLSDGREFKAKVKGSDPRADLAVIKIDANNLPVVSLGDSDNLKIGQWVVAIGNPFGFALDNPEPTVTVGVVSALHRSLGRSFGRGKDYSDLIQTDAAINPGNSGGPLVNLSGEIIGINVAIFSTSGGYEGIGFAIPVNSAKRIVSKLIKGEEIEYGWLGITIQNIDQKLADYLKLETKEGVLVVNVLKDSPAQIAGIKSSDVIIEFASKKIKNTNELLKIVGQVPVGTKINIVILRDKKMQTFQVTVGKRPSEEKLVSNEPLGQEEEEAVSQKWRGLSVKDLNESLVGRYNISPDTKGVIVAEVEPGSVADEAGILAGDVIAELNKQKVSNTADFNRIKEAVSGDCLVKTLRGYFVISAQ